MIEINQLRLHLPAGFEHRAHRISRGIARQLANCPVSASRHIEALSIAKVRVDAGRSDRAIAAQIAGAIRMQLDSGADS
jgi:hypothetical protein